MVLIKRYQNRKLYDTVAKQYITLEGIAELVRLGTDIQVVDNTSGEDLTAFTLTQIILSQEKRRDGLLNHSFLAELIRTRGEKISALKSSLQSAVPFWRQIDDEIKRRIQNLVDGGELSEAEAARLSEKLVSPAALQSSESNLIQEVESFFARNRLPTHDDIQRLYNQIDDLSKKLAEISDKEL